MSPEIEAAVNILLRIAVVLFLIISITHLAAKLNKFSCELDYINMEIRRATAERRKYWKRKRRRLWLSLLPFFPE